MINFDPNHQHYEDNVRVLEFSQLAKDIKPNVLRTNASFVELEERKVLRDLTKSFFNAKFSWKKKN